MARPPSYKPEYCEALIAHMTEGYSYETFSAKIGTSRSTLYEWENKYPEFSDTKRNAVELCQFWWEKTGKEGLHAVVHYDDDGKKIGESKLNAAMWIFNMKARFRWKDEAVKTDEIQEKAILTLEDKKKLLIEAKKEIEKLEEEVSANQEATKEHG
jgi:hypothetical protein